MPYPFGHTIGERYAINFRFDLPNRQGPCEQSPIEDEGRGRIVAGVILDQEGTTPRGRLLRAVTLAASSQYGIRGDFLPVGELKGPYRGRGAWLLDGNPGPRGRRLKPYVTVGCRAAPDDADLNPPPGFVEDDFGPGWGLVKEWERLQEISRLQAFPDDSTAGPRGRTLRFKGTGGCPNVLIRGHEVIEGELGLPDEERWFWTYGPVVDTQSLYHFDVFGSRCVSCPILFVTYEVPCFGCSFRPVDAGHSHGQEFVDWCGHRHSERVTDWCAESGPQVETLGKAHCIPPDSPHFVPDWGIACDIDPDTGAIGDHHCEECVYERLLGRLINIILERSDCLSKVPMRPVRHRESAHNCGYGCGEFGWTMWGGGSAGLRIHGVYDPDQGKNGFLDVAHGAFLGIKEQPCDGPTPQCINSNGWITSGFAFCGLGLRFCDPPFVARACTSTHIFRWQEDDAANRIVKAYTCFKQWEACGDIDGLCPSSPFSEQPELYQAYDPERYHGPGSQIMVWVESYIEIRLAFLHWGPVGDFRVCCGGRPDLESERIEVTLIGKFCGPVPWGDFSTGWWFGYDPDNNGREAVYPGTFFDRQASGSADNRGSCGSMFVDQGSYDDPLGGVESTFPEFDFFDPFHHPPKRCPSRLAGPKFWCPPSLDWSWSYTPGTDNWRPLPFQPNQHSRQNQCWSLQLVKNNVTSCAQGSTHDNTVPPVGCISPDCRRGCSLIETKDGDGVRVSPWNPFFPRATPWGCGHCVDEYPLDPFAHPVG